MVRDWLRRHRAGWIAGLYIVGLILTAGLVPLLTGADAGAISDDAMTAPLEGHFLGTDDLGRDVLLGLVEGIQVSLGVGFAAALAATLLGILVGAAAGFYGGLLDLAVMRIAELFQVLPSFILAAVIVAMLGPGLTRIVAVIALLAWPQVARVMRGEVLRVQGLPFVDAVRCLGYSNRVVLVAEVIPNAVGPVLAMSTLIVGQAILLEASLGFLGLSSADIISWGRMLNAGQRFLFEAWWLSVFPGAAIFLTVLAFNLLGDAIGDRLSTRGRG